MRTRMKKMLASLCITVVAIAVTVSAPLSVWAAGQVVVSARRDDVYNQLMEAAKINVIANTLKKCLGSIDTNISASDAKAGNIFSGGWTGLSNTDISTALWVEDMIQGNGGDDGAIWCKQEGGGQNILQLFASLTGMNLQTEILCTEGAPGLLVRWEYTVDGWTRVERNCSSFDSAAGTVLYNPRGIDAGGSYDADSERSYFLEYVYKPWYNSKKSENPYLPSPSEIGSFNNVDGYFNYIMDFNLKCAASATRVTAGDKQSATDYYRVTQYDKTGNKIIATNYYYQLSSNKYWTYSLSADNSVTSCSALLERIEALQTTNNGIPIGDRTTGGYENIILDELNTACGNAKTSEGNNGWEELRNQLQAIADDPEVDEETVAEANANIATITDIINSGNYTESSGSEDDEGGKVYECVNIDGLVINVDSYDTPITDAGPGSVSGTTSNDDPCYDAGVEGMSWVLCPAMNNMKYTASALDAMIEGMLKVDTKWYNNDSQTHDVWEIMRNFANGIMIIVLLAIIFSQLTGHGIDNYGIKKMLPRLVLMAVLINLSFIICEVVIDLANILGESLRDLFGAIGQNLLDNAGFLSGGEDFIAKIITMILAAAGVASAALIVGVEAGTALSSGMTVMAVIIIVLALVVILAAILLFFLALAARLIIVIGCVATAPIALACFILPNTQFVFKKWLSAFKMVLLMYPICGALGGIGILIRGIVAPTEGVHIMMLIVALVVPFLPFFLIPSMVKGALSGLGQVGAALTAMGMSWRGGIKNSRDQLRHTEMYAATMERGRRNTNFKRAGLQYDRKTGEVLMGEDGKPKMRNMNRLQRFMAGGDVGIARARAQALKDMDVQNREHSLMGGGFDSAIAGARDRAATEAVETMRVMMRQETGNYDNDIMGTQLGDLLAKMNTTAGLTDSEKDRVRALSAQLASQSGGAKKIYEAMKDRGGDAAKLMGQYMANNDKVRQALQSKSQRTASRIADVASGAVDANISQSDYDAMNNQYLAYKRQQIALGQQVRDEADWRNEVMHNRYVEYQRQQTESGQPVLDEATWRTNEESAGRGIDSTTVIQNIARNVLDKDKDFVTQSGAEVRDLVEHLDQDRINRMAANNTLFGYGDVAEGVGNTIRGMASETYIRDGSTERVQIRNIQPGSYERFDEGSGEWITENTPLSGYTPESSSNEFYVRHEQDAVRMGKTTITIPPNILAGTPSSTFEGYAVPMGFNNGMTTIPVRDPSSGHYIYKDASDASGRRGWDATVGRYIDISGLGI